MSCSRARQTILDLFVIMWCNWRTYTDIQGDHSIIPFNKKRPDHSTFLVFYDRVELTGAEKKPEHVMIVMSSDRGLCGAIHSSLSKIVRHEMAHKSVDKHVKLVLVGDKSRQQLQKSVFCACSRFSGFFVLSWVVKCKAKFRKHKATGTQSDWLPVLFAAIAICFLVVLSCRLISACHLLFLCLYEVLMWTFLQAISGAHPVHVQWVRQGSAHIWGRVQGRTTAHRLRIQVRSGRNPL